MFSHTAVSTQRFLTLQFPLRERKKRRLGGGGGKSSLKDRVTAVCSGHNMSLGRDVQTDKASIRIEVHMFL